MGLGLQLGLGLGLGLGFGLVLGFGLEQLLLQPRKAQARA